MIRLENGYTYTYSWIFANSGHDEEVSPFMLFFSSNIEAMDCPETGAESCIQK